jgi:hypothetical protein
MAQKRFKTARSVSKKCQKWAKKGLKQSEG